MNYLDVGESIQITRAFILKASNHACLEHLTTYIYTIILGMSNAMQPHINGTHIMYEADYRDGKGWQPISDYAAEYELRYRFPMGLLPDRTAISQWLNDKRGLNCGTIIIRKKL